MSLKNGKEIIIEAGKKGNAVGGFDAFNMESVQAVIAAAEETNKPVFLQMGIVSLQHAGLGYGIALIKEAARQASVPICLHLDHGPDVSDISQLKDCMDAGFNSIMVDGSNLSFDENIALTRKVVEMAHEMDVCVEGEIGKVSRDLNASREEVRNIMTDPDQARRFVDATGVDYLAISVGSVSGFYKGQIELDIERLKEIRKVLDVPLVFHGGTMIPVDQLREAIRCGLGKVNIAHGVRKAFWDGMYKESNVAINSNSVIDPRNILRQAKDSAKEYVKQKIGQLIIS